MKDLKVREPEVIFPDLAALPEMFESAMPISIPPMEYQEGIIPIFGNWLHKKKVRQMKEVAEMEAEIEDANTRRSNAVMDRMISLITFGQRYEMTVATHRDQLETMRKNQAILDEKLKQEQLKTYQMNIEAQSEALDLKQKKKEMDEDGSDEA